MRSISFGRVNIATPGTTVKLGTTTLSGNVASSDATISVTSALGFCQDMLPFRLDVGVDPTYEKMMVTAISGTTFSVTRGMDGSSPRNHASGDAAVAKYIFAGWYMSVVAGLTGKMYWGTKSLVGSTWVGVIKEFCPNASSVDDDDFTFLSDSDEGNPLSLSEYSIDAAVAGEGLILALWQR